VTTPTVPVVPTALKDIHSVELILEGAEPLFMWCVAIFRAIGQILHISAFWVDLHLSGSSSDLLIVGVVRCTFAPNDVSEECCSSEDVEKPLTFA
jgi:hypothetical protein